MNEILLHNGNNNYKLPHVGKLKIEKAVGGNISMRLPCRALIDGGALDCQYITTFLSNGKFIVVLTASLCCRRCPSSSIASTPSPSPLPSPLPSSVAPSPLPTTTLSSICTIAVPVRHRRRRPSATSPLPLPSAIAVVVIVIVLVLHRAVAVAIIVNVICARRAVEGGIVVIVLCLSAYSASLPHHSHPLFFDCYIKKSRPCSRRIPMKLH
jgi:hypothetical protein